MYELIVSQPSIAAMLGGLLPSPQIVINPGALYIAIGILGATVMPHNLYLHSSIVQTRAFERNDAGKAQAIKFATIDSTVALLFAFFINAAILILAAAAFHGTEHASVADIGDAYKLLTPVLGATFASTLFAVALLASGQNSTLTGTLAGQIVMEGFLNIRMRPWLRRLITRAIAIVPAVIVAALYGERGTGRAADPQPGDPVAPAELRGRAAGHVHQRQGQDGPLRQPALADHSGLGGHSW